MDNNVITHPAWEQRLNIEREAKEWVNNNLDFIEALAEEATLKILNKNK